MSARRIAVLVDGDNVSPVHAAEILSEGVKLGRVDIARVYTSGAHSTVWLSEPGYRIIHSGAGKNSADILLSIDAMELAFLSGIETFVVATSDGDFSHVGLRLRERGLHVLGLGEEKAPPCFRMACSAFTILKNRKPAAPKVSKPVAAIKAAAQPAKAAPYQVTELDKKIRELIDKNSIGGRGIRIARLGATMSTQHKVLISKKPEKSWRAYLTKRPALFDIDPRGPEAMVRYRMEGFTQP